MNWNRTHWTVIVEWPREGIPLYVSSALVLLCLLTLGWTLAGGNHIVLWALLGGDLSLFVASCLTTRASRSQPYAPPLDLLETVVPSLEACEPCEADASQAEQVAALEEEINLYLVRLIREMGFVPSQNRWVSVKTGEEARPQEATWLRENIAELRKVARNECAIRRHTWGQG